MPDLNEEIEIRQDQADAIARGLYAVAKADGTIHPREAALISDFFAGTTDHVSDLAALERQEAIDGAHLAAVLPDRPLRHLFIKTAILLAYADGSYGVAESKLIGQYAKALEIDDADMRHLETQVKEFMLGQLTHLKNVEAVAQVSRELSKGK
jgi:tellurite resistance protein